MATNPKRNSSIEFLQELEAISQSLFRPKNNRRTASLILDRSSASVVNNSTPSDRGSLSHRWPSNPNKQTYKHDPLRTEKNKGIWSWKPLRALSHMRMQRIGCLFIVKVISIRGLQAATNGLRLSVAVRKKETKGGAVRTLPSHIHQGSADFNETLFLPCHLYCDGRPPVFEPRLFLISVVAVDAPELHLGTSTVDLSLLVKESIDRSFEGDRMREWDMSFKLSGKATGGELLLKLGFQIMEEGDVSIYSEVEGYRKKNKGKGLFSSSFRFTGSPSVQKLESELKIEDLDLPEIEVVDMGIEKEAERDEDDKASQETPQDVSTPREVVKEVIHQRMLELESIAKEIKALETTMAQAFVDTAEQNKGLQLDVEEERVTREFFRVLQLGDNEENSSPNLETPLPTEATDSETKVLIPDLGKGLGPLVQTKDGGYLVSMNPFDMKVQRQEIPKLAVQISRPFIIEDQKQEGGLEIFQRLTAIGPEELVVKLLSLSAMDELLGKTAEQVAFEGVASAIISGRNTGGGSFSAASLITNAKMMANAILHWKEERTANEIWNAQEVTVTKDYILCFSMPIIEKIAIEGLKIQAEMTQEEAPFDISNLVDKEFTNQLLNSAISLSEWASNSNDRLRILLTVQLRDPSRQYEPVGGLQVALLEAVRFESSGDDDEIRFKVTEVHVGGLKSRSGEGQRQQLSALQWLMSTGMSKAGWNKKIVQHKKRKDIFWSFSSRLEENMWLKPRRNPDVKFSS